MKTIFFSFLILSFVIDNGNLSAQWQNTGLDSLRNICTIVTNGTNIFNGTSDGKVYRSTDNGNSWKNIISLSNSNNSIKIYSLGVNGTNIFVGTDGGIYLSNDNGESWREALSINKTVYSLAINGTNIFAGTNQGLYLSTNNGISWKLVDNILTNARIFTLGLNTTSMFAGVAGSSLSTGGIYISTDNGSNWKSLLPLNNSVSTIAVSGTNIFAGTDIGSVYLSTDNGINWSLANAGVVYSSDWSVAISGNNIFSATQFGGVYVSGDFGNTWGMESDALIFNSVTSLAINDQFVFVGTGSSGLWKRPISEILKKLTSVETENSFNIPSDYHFEQNYPNPFNPATTINYSVPKQSNVLIVIYDGLGRKVTTLVNEEKSAGNYKTEFKANNLPSGIYFYRIHAGNFIQTKKMILLK